VLVVVTAVASIIGKPGRGLEVDDSERRHAVGRPPWGYAVRTL